MVQATPGVSELAKALAKAQGEFPLIPKNKTTKVRTKSGAEYSYNYADLPSILDLTRKPLSVNGLAVAQMTVVHEGAMLLVTRLLHASGEYIEASYPLPIGAAAQDMGSAITYARRYTLCPLLGIAPEDDDDGKAAQENDARPSAPPAQPKVIPGFGKQPKPKEEKKPEPAPNDGLANVTITGIQSGELNGIKVSKLSTSSGDYLVRQDMKGWEELVKAAQQAALSKTLVVIDYTTTPKGNNVVKSMRVEG